MGKDTENLSDDYKGNTGDGVRELVIPDEQGGQRLDQALSALLPEFSRNRIQNWIRARKIAVDDAWGTTKMKVSGGESVRVEVEPDPNTMPDAPEEIPLDVVFEDTMLMVVNKPVGLVVHPGSGNRHGTLLNALLHRVPQVADLPRAGIVHRLDKDTSGLLVVAKTLRAHTDLAHQLQARTVKREYLALVYGEVCTLETGRTHQIRVHMQHIGHPLVGEPIYSASRRNHLKIPFPRQALHAERLGLIHPVTQEFMQWECPLPPDFVSLLSARKPGPLGQPQPWRPCR